MVSCCASRSLKIRALVRFSHSPARCTRGQTACLAETMQCRFCFRSSKFNSKFAEAHHDCGDRIVLGDAIAIAALGHTHSSLETGRDQDFRAQEADHILSITGNGGFSAVYSYCPYDMRLRDYSSCKVCISPPIYLDRAFLVFSKTHRRSGYSTLHEVIKI
jgi:hypothetical protein